MRWGRWFLLAVAAIAALAPLLANELPLIARVDGALRFPAFASYIRTPALEPGGTPWKDWWMALPEDSDDWAVMPPWPYGPGEVLVAPVRERPSLDHPFGVDDIGRDQLARIVHGAGTALFVALGAASLGLLVGGLIGGFAALVGRGADFVVLRLIELFACFPSLLAVLAVAAAFGGSRVTIVVTLGFVYWTAFARVVRGELHSLRERPFVLAARGLGVGPLRLLWGHLLPQLSGPVLVTAALLAADAILVESTLTFLGLGGGIDSVSWGAMLDQGRDHAHTGAWHLWVFPGLSVASVVLALHAIAATRDRTTAAPRPRRR